MRMWVLFSLLVGVVAAQVPGAPGASGAGAPGAGAPGAGAPGAGSAAPGVSAVTAAGLRVAADVRPEHLAGFTMLVQIVVENPTKQEAAFPDLSARPWLVHFVFAGGGLRQDRANTPPASDGGAVWRLPPGGRRSVLLEVPLSADVRAGSWSLTVEIRDPLGLSLPAQSVRVSPAQPVAGRFLWDGAASQASGAAMAWLHRASTGYDLYLMTFKPREPAKIAGQYALAHLNQIADPWLSRTRASDTGSRYAYWMEGPQALRALPIDGVTPGAARTVVLPWPRVDLLSQGITDGRGGLQIPIWVPAPRGEGGSVKIAGLDKRGALQIRTVADLPARPLAATGIDAAGNLLLAVGHAAAVDLYRLDPAWPAELPARGARALTLDPGWRAAALGWDVLPDRADRPGGLALQTLLLDESRPEARRARRVHSDLSGRTLLDSGPAPWALPGSVSDNLPAGEASYTLSRDGSAAWYAAPGAAPIRLEPTPPPGMLFSDREGVKLRALGGPGVVQDRLLGPILP